MKCIGDLTDLKEQRQMHCHLACQKDAKEGDKDFGNDDPRARSHPAKFRSRHGSTSLHSLEAKTMEFMDLLNEPA